MINKNDGRYQKYRKMYVKKHTATNRNAKSMSTKEKMVENQTKRCAYRMRVLNRENRTLKNKLEIYEKARKTSEKLMEEKVEVLELLVEDQNLLVKSLWYSV